MSYASKSGRARTNARNPQAHAICDRCGGRFNHVDLGWQHDWAGASMINKRILVCRSCMDKPQSQLRSIIVSADPIPILNPRPQDFVNAETDRRVTSGMNTVNARTGIPVPGGDERITQDVRGRVVQQTGAPDGSLNNEPGTDPNAPGNSNPGLPYLNTEVPKSS